MQAGIEPSWRLACGGESRSRRSILEQQLRWARTVMGQRRRRCENEKPGSIHPYWAQRVPVLRIRATPRLRVQPALASETSKARSEIR